MDEGEQEAGMSIPKIVSFSGGQTSGYMLRRLMDENPQTFDSEFRVVFENTGKEHNSTLEFVHEVETRWGVPIVWLEYTRVPASTIDPAQVPKGRKLANLYKAQAEGSDAHWFRVVTYETAARRFDPKTPFDELLGWANGLPNVQTRRCSVQLKIRTRDRYLRSIGVAEFESYIGIRVDEAHRKLEILANVDKYEQPVFPLIDAKITKREVDAFWANNPFRLQIPNFLGNCDLCFLKARWKRLAAAEAEPHAAQWWADWENRFAAKIQGDGAYFRKGESYEGLIHEATQPRLPLVMEDDDVPCSCSIGGYRGSAKDDDE